MTSRPELCRAVAELIPGARFEVLEDEAQQPFQEVPDEWNSRVDAFWSEIEARAEVRLGERACTDGATRSPSMSRLPAAQPRLTLMIPRARVQQVMAVAARCRGRKRPRRRA
jgi:hypothetical protein